MKQFALCSKADPVCDLGPDGGPAVLGLLGPVVACDSLDHPWHTERLLWRVRPGPLCPAHQCEKLYAVEQARSAMPPSPPSGHGNESLEQMQLRDLFERQQRERGQA